MYPFRSLIPCLLLASAAHGRLVEYDLTVEEKKLSVAGKSASALTLNGGVPGPTLVFREGDVARVLVRNRLRRETTSIHWHGVLLPNEQDGVPYLTTPPIQPGQTHLFEFPLTHSGTYWYHSHTGLQEQRGVYGAIVVHPKGGEPARADREHVLVLSDWTRESPNEVMRTLMRGGDWYPIRKGTAQSILGAASQGMSRAFWEREWNRQPAMDIADVAYDAFLINGSSSIVLAEKNGETARLRVINAGASTYFYLQFAAGPMTIVAADGPAVEPIQVNRLLMGMGETYDVLVRVPRAGSWEVRATAQDGSGHASAFLGQGERHLAPDIPKLNPYDMNEAMAGVLDALDVEASKNNREALRAESARPLSPYPRLRAKSPYKQARNPRVITLHLTGDMARYAWSFNNKTLKEDSVIRIKRGEVIRVEMINDTMMHHPIHLHGHFFRLLMGQGARSPLKHTVDVPPMTRRAIEFEANERGDWFFHCHLLYHMEAGMARVFSYDDQGEDHVPDVDIGNLDPFYFMIDGSIQSHMSMGMATLMNAKNNIDLMWDVGWRDMTEYEVDLRWSRYFNPNVSLFGGYRLTNREDARDRGFAGVEYRLPLMIESALSVDTEGEARISLGKSFPLTSRLSAFGQAQYDTHEEWMWTAGLHYTLSKQFGLITQYDSDHGFGGGISFRF